MELSPDFRSVVWLCVLSIFWNIHVSTSGILGHSLRHMQSHTYDLCQSYYVELLDDNAQC